MAGFRLSPECERSTCCSSPSPSPLPRPRPSPSPADSGPPARHVPAPRGPGTAAAGHPSASVPSTGRPVVLPPARWRRGVLPSRVRVRARRRVPCGGRNKPRSASTASTHAACGRLMRRLDPSPPRNPAQLPSLVVPGGDHGAPGGRGAAAANALLTTRPRPRPQRSLGARTSLSAAPRTTSARTASRSTCRAARTRRSGRRRAGSTPHRCDIAHAHMHMHTYTHTHIRTCLFSIAR